MRTVISSVGCLLLLSQLAAAHVVYDLPKLIDDSQLVAVVQVVSVVQSGSGTISFPDSRNSIPAHFRVATLHGRETLKGALPSGDLVVPYTILYQNAGWAGGVPAGYTINDTLSPGSVRLVFLEKAGDSYHFTNGAYLSVVCSPDPRADGEADDPLGRVVSRIAGTLFSEKISDDAKAEAIYQLRQVRSASAAASLKVFLQSEKARKNDMLRTEAIGALLMQKDDSALDMAVQELEGHNTASQANLLFALSSAFAPSRSISILARALGSSNRETRRYAAIAIYQTGSRLSIPPLLAALDDPDPEVAFAVMQGLGNVTAAYEWRPKSAKPNSDWFRCLNHWREYRQEAAK